MQYHHFQVPGLSKGFSKPIFNAVFISQFTEYPGLPTDGFLDPTVLPHLMNPGRTPDPNKGRLLLLFSVHALKLVAASAKSNSFTFLSKLIWVAALKLNKIKYEAKLYGQHIPSIHFLISLFYPEETAISSINASSDGKDKVKSVDKTMKTSEMECKIYWCSTLCFWNRNVVFLVGDMGIFPDNAGRDPDLFKFS